MSDEDILNARLASQVIANVGEMAISRALMEQASNLRQQLRSAQSSAGSSRVNWNTQADKERQANLIFKNRKLKKENELLSQENERYKKKNELLRELLTKPMEEIASQNESFRATYKSSQEHLAGWVLSEIALRELAIDFGLQLGKAKPEILHEIQRFRQFVLNNSTLYGNNAEDLPLLSLHLEALKNKYKKT